MGKTAVTETFPVCQETEDCTGCCEIWPKMPKTFNKNGKFGQILCAKWSGILGGHQRIGKLWWSSTLCTNYWDIHFL